MHVDFIKQDCGTMGFPDTGKIYFFARRDFLMVGLPLAEGFTSFLPLAAGFLEELPPEGFLMAGAAGLAFLAGVFTLGGGFAFPLRAAGVFLGLGLDSLRFIGGALLRDFGGGLFCILSERKAAQDLSGGANATQSRAAVVNLHK